MNLNVPENLNHTAFYSIFSDSDKHVQLGNLSLHMCLK
jgi:hypothetical protein